MLPALPPDAPSWVAEYLQRPLGAAALAELLAPALGELAGGGRRALCDALIRYPLGSVHRCVCGAKDCPGYLLVAGVGVDAAGEVVLRVRLSPDGDALDV